MSKKTGGILLVVLGVLSLPVGLIFLIPGVLILRSLKKTATQRAEDTPPLERSAGPALAPLPVGERPVNYSGGPTFGSWDTSIHLAAGQLQRFGRAFYGSFPIKQGRRGAAKITGSKGNIYTVTLDRCNCPDFQGRGLPCKHIYALALSLGYTADDFYSCYVSVACDGGKVPRPQIGYGNGLLEYQVHGKNPATGRQNKRVVFAVDEADAVSAAYSAGLLDPISVDGVISHDFAPLEPYQKSILQENNIAIPSTGDWCDGLALLRRLDNMDASVPVGLFEFATKIHFPCCLLSGGEYLLSDLLSSRISQRDQIALYAASVLCAQNRKNLLDCHSDPVSDICYAFADFAAGDEILLRQVLNAITPDSLRKPDKRLAAYKAVVKFFTSR
ncbi:SWIM zinc finger family protein [Lawsonibacter asaccharolyticus]